MTNQAGTVALTFNGEIYNHADLRRELEALGKYAWKTDHSDTEVLLHAYEEWGARLRPAALRHVRARHLRRARSRAARAAPDSRSRRHQADVLHPHARAANGCSPRRFARIVAHPDITPEMDRTAFWHYLTFIVAPAPLTMFRGVFKLPAGHILSIDHTGRGVARQFWDCAPDRAITLSPRRHQRARSGRRADAPAAPVDRQADGVRRAVRRAAVGRRRFLDERRADERADGAAGVDVHDRLRRQGRLQRVPVRAAHQPALQDRSPRDADQPGRDAGLPAAAGPAAGRADRRQRLHPALLPRQAGEGQRHDRRAGRRRRRRELPRLLVVRALPAARRIGVSAGAPATAGLATPGGGAEPAARLDVDRSARGAAARPARRGAVLGRRGLLVGPEARAAHARSHAVRADDRLPGGGSGARTATGRSTATPWSASTSAGSTAGSTSRRFCRRCPTWR